MADHFEKPPHDLHADKPWGQLVWRSDWASRCAIVEIERLRAALAEAADETERQRRLFAALAEVNGWRDCWMNRAFAEMHTVLDAHEEGQPIPESAVQCMTALIAEWWNDGGEDADDE